MIRRAPRAVPVPHLNGMVWDPLSQNRVQCAPGLSWPLLGAPSRSGGIPGAARWFVDAPWARPDGCRSNVAPTFFFIMLPLVFFIAYWFAFVDFFALVPLSLSLSYFLASLFSSLCSSAKGRTTIPQHYRGGGRGILQGIQTRPCGIGGGADGASYAHIYIYTEDLSLYI